MANLQSVALNIEGLLLKLSQLTRGYVWVGGIADTGTALNAKTSGQILVGDGTDLASVAVSGAVTLSSAGLVATSTTANVNVAGGIPVVHRITASTLTGDVDVTLTNKTRIVDVLCIAVGGAGGAGDTITVKNGATAITNAIDMNVADKVIVRAGTIDDASYEIAAAGTLRVTGASGVVCEVVVYGIVVA